MQPVEDLTESEMEIYRMDVTIPIQLRCAPKHNASIATHACVCACNDCRVVQSLRRWLQLSYDDFKNEELSKKLDALIATIERYV